MIQNDPYRTSSVPPSKAEEGIPLHHELWRLVCQHLWMNDVISLARTSHAWYDYLTNEPSVWPLREYLLQQPALYKEVEQEVETDRIPWLKIKKIYMRIIAAIPENMRLENYVFFNQWDVGTDFNCVKTKGGIDYAIRKNKLLFYKEGCHWQALGKHDAPIDRLIIQAPCLYTHCKEGVLKVWDLRTLMPCLKIDCEQFRPPKSKDSREITVLDKSSGEGVPRYVRKWNLASEEEVMRFECPINTRDFDFHKTTLWITTSEGELLRANPSGGYDRCDLFNKIIGFCIQDDLMIMLMERDSGVWLKITNLVENRSQEFSLPEGTEWKDYEGDQQSVGGVFIHLNVPNEGGYLYIIDPVELDLISLLKDPVRKTGIEPEIFYGEMNSFNLSGFAQMHFYDKHMGAQHTMDLSGACFSVMQKNEIESDLKIIEKISIAWNGGEDVYAASLQDQLSQKAKETLNDICQAYHGTEKNCSMGLQRLKTLLHFNLFFHALYYKKSIDRQLIEGLDPDAVDLLWKSCCLRWDERPHPSKEQWIEDLCGNAPFPLLRQKNNTLLRVYQKLKSIWCEPWGSIPELDLYQKDYEALGIPVLKLYDLVKESFEEDLQALWELGGLKTVDFPPLLKPIASPQKLSLLSQEQQWEWVHAVRHELEILVSCLDGDSKDLASYREEVIYCLSAINEENLGSPEVFSDFMNSQEHGIGVFVPYVNQLIAIWNRSVKDHCKEQIESFMEQLKEKVAQLQ